MSHYRGILGAALLTAIAASGCDGHDKPYMRHPLVKEMQVMAAPFKESEGATQAEPYPPLRPILPDQPSNLAVEPIIQTPARTPAN